MIGILLNIIFFGFILFYIFMITPFGAMWIFKNLDENKLCYGIIIMYISVIPVIFIGIYLGYIK